MDIDLLFTESGEAGLLSNQNLIKKALGALIDTQTGLFSIEYNDGDYLEFNIPVEQDYFPWLDRVQQIHVGAIKEGEISQAYQIPLMFADDPYRGDSYGQAQAARNPLVAFEYFVKSCVAGQPVHREDLGDEDKMGCILGDASPSSLQFAPHLARRHSLEASPNAAPSGPGPAGPGLGGGGGSTGGGYTTRTSGTPPKEDD